MKLTSSMKNLLWATIAVVVLGGGYLVGRALYRTPLAPPLNLPTATVPVILPTATNTAAPVEATTETAIIPTATSTTAPTAAETCGQTGSMTILFLGSDSSIGAPPYGADSVRVIKTDFGAQKITVVTFPRNLIVRTTALNNPSYPQGPLGLTFYYAKVAAYGTIFDMNASGARVMAQVMMDNFAIGFTHYVALQMEQVAVMVDTLGGVEMNIPYTITTEHNVTFYAGLQTLSGARAKEYVRFLYPGGEAARTARQNDFIKALLAKVTNASILPLVPTLLSQFKNAVTTDLSTEQLVNLVCLSGKMPKENLTFGNIDIPALVTNNYPNILAIKAYLNQLLGQ
jgi:LCP family protein required for cell wall assembly